MVGLKENYKRLINNTIVAKEITMNLSLNVLKMLKLQYIIRHKNLCLPIC